MADRSPKDKWWVEDRVTTPPEFQKDYNDGSELGRAMAEIARSYVGVEEVPPNKSFRQEEFLDKMTSIPRWPSGAPWCMYFLQLVMIEALQRLNGVTLNDARRTTRKYISPSSITTFNQLLALAPNNNTRKKMTGSEYLEPAVEIHQAFPGIPSLVIYETNRARWQGHGEIAISVHPTIKDAVLTIGGNVRSPDGQEGVAFRARANQPNSSNFKLLGYAVLY